VTRTMLQPSSVLFRALEFYGTRVHHRGQWWAHKKLRSFLRADCDIDLYVTRHGLRWCLNPADYPQADLFWTGMSDRWDSFHVKRLLRPKSVVFDVWANFGYYSLMMYQALEQQCTIHCFEPVEATYKRLVRNIDLNDASKAITSHCLGLSDRSGVGGLVQQIGNSGAARICAPGHGQEISLATLDEFCDAQRIASLDLIKMDVQGFEPRVLRGGEHSIRKYRPIMLIELDPDMLQFQQSSPADLVEMVRGFNYTLHVAKRDRLCPLFDLPTGAQVLNVFCLPESSN
jgi:FkbM family methyltransferase